MEKRKPRYKLRLFILYIFSFIASVSPLLTYFIVKHERYIKSPSDTIKLTFGAVIILTIVLLKVMGTLKLPRRIVLFSLVCLLTYLLEAILNDLLIISLLALAGELLDYFLFQRAIRITKESASISKTADATSAQIEEIFKKYAGRF